jgi:hypothetical protein
MKGSNHVYRLVVLADSPEGDEEHILDSFMVSDEEAGSTPFGMNPTGALQVNLGPRGLHVYASGIWSRLKLVPFEPLKAVEG